MELLGLMGFVGWILGSVVNGMVAAEKNRSVAQSILVSLFVSPVPVYLYLLAVPARAPAHQHGKSTMDKLLGE